MSGKKKIAVLGGGAAALSAAFGLTEKPDWQKDYEITVYQLGWRLGGKGASGRNADHEQRIEEHGLHVWGGFYENSFRVMTACYEEMGRPSGQPLATVWDAFKPQNYVTWMEDVNGGWERWDLRFPPNDAVPGDDTSHRSAWDAVKMSVTWLIEILRGFPPIEGAAPPRARPDWVAAEIGKATAAGAAGHPKAEEDVAGHHHGPILGFLHDAVRLVEHAGEELLSHTAVVQNAILTLLENAQSWLAEHVQPHVQDDAGLRRAAILFNFGSASVLGVLRDGVLTNGFNSIDDEEWRDWLRRHGATDLTLQSALVRGVYDFVFAYAKGDPEKPAIGAGTSTRSLLRLVFNYKGGVFYKMQAGMGDTVFTPLYEALRKRGVKFEFFHRVKNLALSEDGKSIGAIEVGIQAKLKPECAEYQPLRQVADLPCWPSVPNYEQLQDAEALKKVDLESAWSGFKDPETITLKAGEDFDEAVLGISAGAFPWVCPELLAARPEWRDMSEHVQTVATQALQLWLEPEAEGLGWDFSTILTSYAHPIETWADMSQVIPREEWPLGKVPGSIAYFCGPQQDPEEIPPFSDHDYPARSTEEVRAMAVKWLETNTGSLWPGAVSENDPNALDWEKLADVKDREGIERMKAQYWRSNVNPSDRYVIALPGSTRYRLKPGESGFANLFLAGDWVLNGLNFGCVESAVQGGLLASQAICGYPKEITWMED